MGDWTLLWILGGFVLAYFIYIPVVGDRVHPEHWAGSAAAFFIEESLKKVEVPELKV